MSFQNQLNKLIVHTSSFILMQWTSCKENNCSLCLPMKCSMMEWCTFPLWKGGGEMSKLLYSCVVENSAKYCFSSLIQSVNSTVNVPFCVQGNIFMKDAS